MKYAYPLNTDSNIYYQVFIIVKTYLLNIKEIIKKDGKIVYVKFQIGYN